MRHDAVVALLALGCLCEGICVLGAMWMREGFAQLHFSGAASTVGPVVLLVAVFLTGFSSSSGTVDCAAALVLTVLLGPVLVTATARAGRRMRYGSLEPRPEELHRQP